MSEFVLSLRDVTIYQEENAILSDVNLDIKHGEFIYIIGKTGSGKSSFMKTLYGDLPLKSGEGKIVDFEFATKNWYCFSGF
jgi:cell division transport system ATP-binding protein